MIPSTGRRGDVVVRNDGFRNFVKGIGVRGRDPLTATSAAPPTLLEYQELDALYLGDGLVKKIVKAPAQDATRAGWDIAGDPDGKILSIQGRLKVRENFREALEWVRLFGGGLTICLWDDNRPLWAPFEFNPKKPQKLRGLRTHSAAEIWIMPKDLDLDPQSVRYEMPEFYTVRRVYGPPYLVHWTRTIEWRAKDVPDRIYPGMDIYRRHWGFGTVQQVYQSVAAMGLSWNAVANLMQESVIGKYKIGNLAQLLARQDYASIEQRMLNLELSKSVLKGVLLGDTEEYTRDKLEFAGVADVLDRFMMRVSSEANIPVTRLFGRSAAGMNATGEGDDRFYYDGIDAIQGDFLQAPCDQIARWIGAVATPDVSEDEIRTEFRPAQSMSEKDYAETYYKVAQGDSLYKVNGILWPKEIRRNRFVGRYSFHTSLLSTETEPPPDPMMLQLAGPGAEGTGGAAGNLSPHASVGANPQLPNENLKDPTKMRSEPTKKSQVKGVSQPGATKVHTPREGNSITGD